MVTWDDAADWYLDMVRDQTVGFNDLASDVVVDLIGAHQGLDVLDLGCGEGHVARRLALGGARVIGVDPVERFIAAARDAEATHPLGVHYACTSAEDLAVVPEGSVDLVVSVLAVHHVEDIRTAMAEVRRVLRRGGRFVAVIPHPWSDHPDAGWQDDDGALRRTIGSYLVEGRFADELPPGTSPGRIRHIGWHHRTVATWFTLLAETGFTIAKVVEPAGISEGRADHGGPWQAIPRFLAFSAHLT